MIRFCLPLVLLSLKVCERNGIKVLFVARKGCLAEGRESQKISKTLNEREKQKNSKKRTFRVKNTKTKKHE
jgi:hypothetical protein